MGDSVFFFFSKILTVFLFPLPLVILLSILFFFKIRGLRNKLLAFFPILVLWISSSFPVCQYLIRTLEDPFPPIEIKSVPRSDIIVIPCGMINNLTRFGNRIELMNSVERLTDSILLFKEKKAPWILTTGGSGILFYQQNPEAELAKKFLVQMGIPGEKILTEIESRNTAENVIKTATILREKKMRTVILVTSAFHMKRTLALFKNQGFEVTAFPTDYRALQNIISWEAIVPSVGALDTTTIALKEWIGIIIYRLNGYI